MLAWDGGSEARVHARAPDGASCDGLALDAEGGLWVALGPAGAIGRHAPDGKLVEVIDVPADFVASVAFGGQDGHDLYVATIGALLRMRADLAGAPTYRARV